MVIPPNKVLRCVWVNNFIKISNLGLNIFHASCKLFLQAIVGRLSAVMSYFHKLSWIPTQMLVSLDMLKEVVNKLHPYCVNIKVTISINI